VTNKIFGIDFGTTNSLAALVVDNRVTAYTDVLRRPHPSVIQFQGNKMIVGRAAKENLDTTDIGGAPGFIRSPKMALSDQGPIYVEGIPVDPVEAVSAVLDHLKKDAQIPRSGAKTEEIRRAVFTIPVRFGGHERRALRNAAIKAGISVVHFVHEPAAALYAYLRSQPDLGRTLARFEGRTVLVFDWGGGTLDLTLCRIQNGMIMQITSHGNNRVGGDKFDERLRNFIRDKHASAHGLDDISMLEHPGMAAKLLNQCEMAKIGLSASGSEPEDILVKNYLRADGDAKNLVVSITKAELDEIGRDLIHEGLKCINDVLEKVGLTHRDIELCLATGGMVNMPAIRDGLTERFDARAPRVSNGDRIIAEGAAWIAHDGLRLKLSKPIEMRVADTSGSGSYHALVDTGYSLPKEGGAPPIPVTGFYCIDPRDGVASMEIAKPKAVGRASQYDARDTLAVAKVFVDPNARPLIERINCELQIDQNYVVTVTLSSTGRGDTQSVEFYDLDFALDLNPDRSELDPEEEDDQTDSDEDYTKNDTNEGSVTSSANNIFYRPNMIPVEQKGQRKDDLMRYVPGDIVALWDQNYFDNRSREATPRQIEERMFYKPCSTCKRMPSQIDAEGLSDACSKNCRRNWRARDNGAYH
jgi:molecular chaperone DnaK